MKSLDWNYHSNTWILKAIIGVIIGDNSQVQQCESGIGCDKAIYRYKYTA